MNNLKILYFLILYLQTLWIYNQPRILYPQNGQIIDNNQVQIRWKDTASVFDLQWSNSPSFTAPVTISNINQKYYDLPILPYNSKYYFRIRRTGGGWSNIYNFFILDINSIPSLQYWWDVSFGMTSNSGKLSNWQDRISSINASNNNSSFQPEILASYKNGLPQIRFGGESGNSNQSLNLSTPISLTVNNYTIISNFTILSTGLIDYLLGSTQQGLFVGGTLGGYNNPGLFNNPNDIRINESPTYTKDAVYSFYANKIFRNGVQMLTNGTSVPSFQFEQIGTRPDLNTFSFHGYLGDIMIFNEALNDSIRQLVEDYQKWKWLEYPNLGNDTNICASSYTLSVPEPNVYSNIIWSTGEINVPSITINQNGTYWVSVTGYGITLTDTIHIQGIQPQKTLSTTVDTTLCLGNPFILKVINPTPTHQYTWNNGLVQDSIIIQQPGSYYCIEFIPSTNCYISTDTITVNNVVNANFIFLSNSCKNQPVSFLDNSSSINNYINEWNWNFGDPTSTTDTASSFFSTYTYSQEGIYNIQLAVSDTNGCTDTTIQQITINPQPNSLFTYNKECLNDVIQFTNLSTISAPASITAYKWYFGTPANDSSSFINPKFTYNTSGNFVVTLITTSNNGCQHAYTDTLHINKYVDASIILPDDTLCKGQSYSFIDNSNYANTLPAQWQWSISGANVGNQNPQSLTFHQSGLQQVRLIVTSADNCMDSVKTNVFIKNQPIASFTATPQVSAPPLNTVLQYTGTPGVSLAWDLGDNTTETGSAVTHTYQQVGLYLVTLIATDANGCSDTATRTMNVVVPVFDVLLNNLVCTETNGYVQLQATVQNLSTVTITSMQLEGWIEGAQPALDNWQGELFIGNSLNYQTPYSLQLPSEGSMYCCLRIKDISGIISDTTLNKTLCVSLQNAFTIFSPFPNPITGEFSMHIILPIADEAVITITDIQGKLIYEQAFSFTAGLHTLHMDASFLSAGVYAVAVYYRGERQVVRLLKQD